MKYISLIVGLMSPFLTYATNVDRQRSNFDIEFVEGSRAELEAQASIAHNDNFFLSESSKESTTVYSLSSDVLLQAHNEQHLGQLVASGDYVRYEKFSEDDHTDVAVLGKYFYKLASDHRLFISGSYETLYELRGDGITQGNPALTDKGNERELTLVNAGYQYGRVDSVSKLNFVIGQSSHEYTTNRAITSVRDFERDFVNFDIDYLLSAKTYISAVIEYEEIDYQNDNSLSRDVTSALTGIKWQASDITGISLLMGYEDITFEDPLFESSNNFIWRANLDWQPLESLMFNFTTSRRTQESNTLVTSYRTSDLYNVSVNFNVNDFSRIAVKAGLDNAELTQQPLVRQDDELSLALEYHYKYSERLSFALMSMYRDKDSTFNEFDYDNTNVSFTVKVSL